MSIVDNQRRKIETTETRFFRKLGNKPLVKKIRRDRFRKRLRNLIKSIIEEKQLRWFGRIRKDYCKSVWGKTCKKEKQSRQDRIRKSFKKNEKKTDRHSRNSTWQKKMWRNTEGNIIISRRSRFVDKAQGSQNVNTDWSQDVYKRQILLSFSTNIIYNY